MITEQLIEQLMRHEGYRDKVYKCPAGKDTIGYGYNLEANPENISDRVIEQLYKKGITRDFAKELLMLCLKHLEHDLRDRLSWMGKLNGARQAVLINMAYNLGVEGLLKFRMTLRHIELQNWEGAELCLRASLWHKQVGKRALELERQLVLGKYSEEK
jgi:lysozyme